MVMGIPTITHHQTSGGNRVMPDNDIPADLWRYFGHEPPNAPPRPEPRDPDDNVVDISGGRRRSVSPAYARKALDQECAELAATAVGRNDRLNRAAFNLASLVDAGQLDRQETIDALTAAARIASGRGDHPLTDAEIEATLRSAFRGSSEKVGARRIPERSLPDLTVTVIDPDDLGPVAPAAPKPTVAAIFDAEGDFWQARPSLTAIYDAALSRMCAPWAVLAHCAARALTMVRPCVVLPPVIGGKGSLNWFAAVAAPSGGGKGSAAAVARELIAELIRERNLGSGEGIIGAYYRPGSKTEPDEIHEAVLFTADEIDTLTAMNNRSGSTTMATLRSAFAGETLGFSYVTRGRDVHLEAHTYRMTLVISVQPARAGGLLADAGGGTPQRFLWFPGVDHRITDTPDEHHHIYPLSTPSPGEWLYPRTIAIPDEARQLILTERAKNARGEKDALDGHAVFCREKFAYALALLDNRVDMNAEDWRLSGIAAEVSTRTRDWVTAGLATSADQEAEERGRLLGVTYAASDDEKSYRAEQRTSRLARWALDKLDGGPMAHRDLSRAVASRDRSWLKGALEALANAGVIKQDDDGRWVKL